MQLSVFVEKAKTVDKQARPIGSNKPAGQPKKGEQTAANMQKNSQLYQKFNSAKNKNPLEQLEYNYIR